MHLRTTQILLLAFASLFALTSAGPLPQGDYPHVNADGSDAVGHVEPEYNTPCLNATEMENAVGGVEPGVVGIPCHD